MSSHAPCSLCLDFSSGSFFMTSFKVNAWPYPILNHWLLVLDMSLSSILNSSVDSLLNLRQQLILLLLEMHQGIFQGSDLVVYMRFMGGRVLWPSCLLSPTSLASRVFDLGHDLTLVRTFVWSHSQMVMTLELACTVYRIGSCHWQVVQVSIVLCNEGLSQHVDLSLQLHIFFKEHCFTLSHWCCHDNG